MKQIKLICYFLKRNNKMKGRPIKPEDVEEAVKIRKKIPEFVFDIFNELIQEAALSSFTQKRYQILQKDVCKRRVN